MPTPLSKALNAKLKHGKLSINALAKEIGVSVPSLAGILKGTAYPNTRTVEEYDRYFQGTVEVRKPFAAKVKTKGKRTWVKAAAKPVKATPAQASPADAIPFPTDQPNIPNPVLTFVLSVALDGIDPPIWRRFSIPARASLGDLHRVIQVVMGWTNSHLHEFIVGRKHYGLPDPYGDDIGHKIHLEHQHCLAELYKKPKQHFSYVYDFGDNWRHTITVDGLLRLGNEIPQCFEGARACPPDDCGGTRGYEELIQADPEDAEYDEKRKWFQSMTPEGHDPEVFPIAEVNEHLALGLEGLADEFDALAGLWDDPGDLVEPDEPKVIQFPGTGPAKG